MINAAGEPIDVLSANSITNRDADKTAFIALMRHLKEIDSHRSHRADDPGRERVRGHRLAAATSLPLQTRSSPARCSRGPPQSASAQNRAARGAMSLPARRTRRFRRTFSRATSTRSPRRASASSTSRCTATCGSPTHVAELPERQIPNPGIGYPSGGPVQDMIGLWKAFAPAIDMIGPDIYADDSGFYREVILKTYKPAGQRALDSRDRQRRQLRQVLLLRARARAPSASRRSASTGPTGPTPVRRSEAAHVKTSR